MPKIQENPLWEAYLDLSEPKKKQIREEFTKAFDYSEASFYRKLKNPEQIWSHEKSKLSELLKKPQHKLFPRKEAAKC
jgi:hypothetical protein